MDKVQFMVFEDLNLNKYNLYNSDTENLFEDISKEILGKPNEGNIGGFDTNTSAWMNRFACLENGEKTYVIVPSNIPADFDILKATKGKYAILLYNQKEFADFTEEDIKFFQENLPYEFNIDKRKRKQEEKNENEAKLAIRETFRFPLFMCSDDTVEIIRYLIINNEKSIFTDLVLGGCKGDVDILIKIFNKMKKIPKFKDITISVDEFTGETLAFFRPDIQFEPLGIDVKSGIYFYLGLCEDTWLREMFLGISEKEVRDIYKNFVLSSGIF